MAAHLDVDTLLPYVETARKVINKYGNSAEDLKEYHNLIAHYKTLEKKGLAGLTDADKKAGEKALKAVKGSSEGIEQMLQAQQELRKNINETLKDLGKRQKNRKAFLAEDPKDGKLSLVLGGIGGELADTYLGELLEKAEEAIMGKFDLGVILALLFRSFAKHIDRKVLEATQEFCNNWNDPGKNNKFSLAASRDGKGDLVLKARDPNGKAIDLPKGEETQILNKLNQHLFDKGRKTFAGKFLHKDLQGINFTLEDSKGGSKGTIMYDAQQAQPQSNPTPTHG